MHIFLTGEIQVGKSTLIRNVLFRLGISAGGFKTIKVDHAADDGADIFIFDYNDNIKNRGIENRVAHRSSMQKGFEVFPDVFDSIGSEHLLKARGFPLIVMDELGFLESRAEAFKSAVFECLDSDIPVLGVIKPLETEFLNKIREHPQIKLITVTISNRDEILNKLLEHYNSVYETIDTAYLYLT